jgi:gas vesicle protein
MISFIIGVFVGVALGVFILGLLVAARDNKDWRE